MSLAAGAPSPPVTATATATAPPVTPPPAARREGPTPRALPPAAPRETPRAATNGTSEKTESGKLAGPDVVGALGPGAGGDTIAGQRALLPHAATCADPVTGKWEALKYSPVQGDWVHFALMVHRDDARALHGTILSHTWSGTAFDRSPPGCSPGGFDLTVSMNATGRADAAGRITFGSSAYSIVAVRCMSLNNSYAPDNFTGIIDPARQEFQSVNNDGANDVNAPYVFRRTGCLDARN